jgi:hypothetical protein
VLTQEITEPKLTPIYRPGTGPLRSSPIKYNTTLWLLRPNTKCANYVKGRRIMASLPNISFSRRILLYTVSWLVEQDLHIDYSYMPNSLTHIDNEYQWVI